MKTNEKRFWLILAALTCVNLAAHLVIYPQLPQQVPLHWNAQGHIDRYGSRSESLLLSALPLLMLLLFYVIPKIDPRGKAYQKFQKLWQGFVVVMLIFMMGISWITEASVFGWISPDTPLVMLMICTLIGLGMMVLGNYLPRVQQNYTFGIKTPWTLADTHTWNRTHRMGGICCMVMGITLIVCGFASRFLQEKLVIVLLAVILGGTAWLYIYSYLVYSKKLR